jgi:hypothetical protein
MDSIKAKGLIMQINLAKASKDRDIPATVTRLQNFKPFLFSTAGVKYVISSSLRPEKKDIK